MSEIYRLKEDDSRFKLSEGDLLLGVPYWLDPDKVTILCRITDGFQPDCNQYRRSVEQVTDDDLFRLMLETTTR